MIRLLFAVLILGGCNYSELKGGGESVGAQPPEPSFEWVNQNVLRPICMNCHVPGHASGYEVTSYESVMLAVKPFSPEESPLCQVLKKGLMPFEGPPLEEEVWRAVCEWIELGAKEKEDE